MCELAETGSAGASNPFRIDAGNLLLATGSESISHH